MKSGRVLRAMATLAALGCSLPCETEAAAPQGVGGLRVRPARGLVSRCKAPDSATPSEVSYDLFNPGDSDLSWSATASEPWIRLSSVGGTLKAREVLAVAVSIDAELAGRLESGRYRGHVSFETPQGKPQLRSVGIDVLHPGLNVRPPRDAVELFGPPGGPFSGDTDPLFLLNGDDVAIEWAATASAQWLRVSESEGRLEPGARAKLSFEVRADETAALPEGTHEARLVVRSDGGGQEIGRDVLLHVRVPAPLVVEPATDPAPVTFAPGGTEAPRILHTLENAGTHEIEWRAACSARWLSLPLEHGRLAPGEEVQVEARVTPRVERMEEGVHRGLVTFVNATDGVGTTSRRIELRLGGARAEPGSPEPAGDGGTTTIRRFGVTWTFDRVYEAGVFANGDPWLVGPALLVAVDPPSLELGERTINGSMVNPSPRNGWTQGYDSATYDTYREPSSYDPELNVALGLSPASPLLLRPNTSLVSTISVPEAGARPQIQTAAVLTVLRSVPPKGSFRPAYVGHDKSIRFKASQLEVELLETLKPVASTPDIREVERWFQRPWLDHVPDWIGRYIHPRANMPDYGREMTDRVGVASLMLHLDIPLEEKRTLLVRFVQLGIDFHGILREGGRNHWPAGGGHHSGRKWPILFAGLMLGDSEMTGVGFTDVAFNEDDQTFYVEETSPGVVNHGIGGYGAEHIGMAEWGQQHWKQIRRGQPPSMDDGAWFADPYRLCCTANVWWGEVLAARIMGVVDLWNHDALFDYQDRYFEVNERRGVSGWRLSWSRFPLDMWRTYRARF